MDSIDDAQSGRTDTIEGNPSGVMSDIATPVAAVAGDAEANAAAAAAGGGTSASSVTGKKGTVGLRNKRELAGLTDSLSAPPSSAKRPRRGVAAGSAPEASLSPISSRSDSPGASIHTAGAGARTHQAASVARSSKRVIARSSESADEQAATPSGSGEGPRSGEQPSQQQEETLNVVPLTGSTDRPPRKIGRIKLRVAQTASASAPDANASPSNVQRPTQQSDSITTSAAAPVNDAAPATPVVLGQSSTMLETAPPAKLAANPAVESEPLPPPVAPDLADSQGQADHPAEGGLAQLSTEGAETPALPAPVQSTEGPASIATPTEQRVRAMATKRKGPRATGESASKRVSLARKLASSSSDSEDASGASSSSKPRAQAGKLKQPAQQPQPVETANQPASTKKSSSLTYVGATSSGPTDPTHNVSKLPTGASGSGTPAVPGAGAAASAKKGSALGAGKPSVPMPFKKKLGAVSSSTPGRTAAVNAPTPAAAPAAAAGSSFLDSLFAGTIAQTDHEKQLAQEREEKARAAKETREREALEKRKQLMARSSQDRDRLDLEQALRRESGAGNSGSGTEGEGGSDKKRGKAGTKVSPASQHLFFSLSRRRR